MALAYITNAAHVACAKARLANFAMAAAQLLPVSLRYVRQTTLCSMMLCYRLFLDSFFGILIILNSYLTLSCSAFCSANALTNTSIAQSQPPQLVFMPVYCEIASISMPCANKS